MTQKIFYVPVTLHATAYVVATTAAAARKKATELRSMTLEFTGLPISGRTFADILDGVAEGDEALRLTLSPAMTAGHIARTAEEV